MKPTIADRSIKKDLEKIINDLVLAKKTLNTHPQASDKKIKDCIRKLNEIFDTTQVRS